MKKTSLFLIIVGFALILLYIFSSELSIITTLESVKASHDKWVNVYLQNKTRFIIYFILFNLTAAMLPIPGISMISFFGGTIFGFWPAFIYSSLATAIGNLGGFFIGRYFLQDYVHLKYGDELIVFREDWQRDGAMALFSMRLFPFVPSFVANLVMGVSNLLWWTFFWVSWVGRIPMVVLYAWSGVQLAKINVMEDILTQKVIIAFILMGSLPWIFSKGAKLFTKRSA